MSIREWIAQHFFYKKFPPSNDPLAYNLRWGDIPFDGCESSREFYDNADQILTYPKAEIEKCLLTDEEIEQVYFECGELNKPSLHYLNERLAQAQVKKAIELLEE